MYCQTWRIELVKDRVLDYPKTVAAPEEATRIIRALCGASPTEKFVVIALNGRLEVMGASVVAHGGTNAVSISMADILTPVLLAGAKSFIIGHNHPSGSVAPSEEDLAMTRKCVEAANLMGLTLLDHIIVDRNDRSRQILVHAMREVSK